MANKGYFFFVFCLTFFVASVNSLCDSTASGSLCQTCADTNNCGNCLDGYGLKFVGAFKECAACPNNCQLCVANNTQCTACSSGYGVITGGQCASCFNIFCSNC